ncbi:GbsR/MarR family transcriptional regulator [Paenibacillus doosanensis]|uniref:GbsR/MarR family transcriptional regulator n=1 Tax=Paenibacillus doosanensis TaxID=1229154 RepID=UPI0021800B79|nr:GbsR/MarR family transcriptional regulator [Paenibacillus doosanensis]MCS7464767.1 GbsR/MarR family transcriptional regulator [Paenibacillus doosanensis]
MNGLEGLTPEQELAIQKARKRIIESIGKNMDLYGITLSHGLLYGLMFFQNGPMTLDDMGQAMEMSKTSMSTGIRTLLDMKMVNQVWEKGSRKDFYEVESDWYQTFADFFGIKWRKALEINLQSLRKSLVELQALAERFPEDAQLQACLEIDITKIKEAIAYYKWLGKLIDSLESGEIYQFIPKEPPESK